MPKPKEIINLNIDSVEESESEDEFEYESSDDNVSVNETVDEEGNIIVNYNENENENEIENDSLENNNYEDSITKSENKITLSDALLEDVNDSNDDDDYDENDDESDDEDVFSITLPDEEMKQTLQIPDNERISRNILTKYEMVRLLGTRAKQISDGSKVFVKYDGAKSAMELAELELKYKMIPLKIKRPMPNGKYEIWKISELEIINI